MTTVTFEQFQQADEASIQLNDAGIAYLKDLVEEYANFEWFGDSRQIEALSSNDIGFDDDGYISLELAAFETKSGNPHTYELDFEEHFDCEIK